MALCAMVEREIFNLEILNLQQNFNSRYALFNIADISANTAGKKHFDIRTKLYQHQNSIRLATFNVKCKALLLTAAKLDHTKCDYCKHSVREEQNKR